MRPRRLAESEDVQRNTCTDTVYSGNLWTLQDLLLFIPLHKHNHTTRVYKACARRPLLLLVNQRRLGINFPSSALFNQGIRVTLLHCALQFHQDRKQTSPKSATLQRAQSSGLIINIFLTLILPQQHRQNHKLIGAPEKKKNTVHLFNHVFFSSNYSGTTLKCRPRTCLVTDPSVKRSPTSQSQVRPPVQFLCELVCYSAGRHWGMHFIGFCIDKDRLQFVHFFLPRVMTPFSLSDDPLLIERPPGKSINQHYLLSDSAQGLLNRERMMVPNKQLNRVIFCLHSSLSNQLQ